MASWVQISGTVPQYQKSDGTLASGYYIKFYNTSNGAINMASDTDGGGLLDKALLDSSGYPLNGSSDRFIPTISQDYKIALYTNATDADNDTTASAVWFVGPYKTFLTTGTVEVDVAEQQEDQTATYGQTDFTIVGFTFVPGSTGNLTVYANGMRTRRGVDYTEKSGGDGITWIGDTLAEGASVLFVRNELVSSSAPLASNVSYMPAGVGAVITNVETKLRESVSVKDFGAVGDGVADDTAAIQAALNYSPAVLEFDGVDTYLTGSLNVPSNIIIKGSGATIKPLSTPSQIFYVDATSTVKEHIKINGFILDGACTYFIHQEGGLAYFNEYTRINVNSGSGTAIVRFYNDSSTNAPTRNIVDLIDHRDSGWTYCVLVQRGATALANSIAHDNLSVTKVNSWTNDSVIKIECPCNSSKFEGIYGGLFNASSKYVVHVDVDSGTTEALTIKTIHAEMWEANQASVLLSGVEYSTIDTVRAIRINTSRTGCRAVKCESSKFNTISNFGIRDTGQSFDTTPAGFYPAIEFDSASIGNRYFLLDRSLSALRVQDSGYQNTYAGDKNDSGFYTDNSRDTVTGTVTETTLKSYTFGGNELRSSDGFKVVISGSIAGTNDTKFVYFKWDGNIIPGTTLNAGAGDTGSFFTEVYITNTATNAQRISLTRFDFGAFGTNVNTTTAIDTTSDVAFSVNGELVNTSDTINVDQFIVTPIRRVGAS